MINSIKMSSADKPIKGRGAQKRIHNKYFELEYIPEDDYLEYCRKDEDEEAFDNKTHIREVFPKTIVNKVNSPDLHFKYSLNPYQGCEHGCVYCYARNSHQYWGYGPGKDFEQQILVKKNAPQLLAKTLNKKNWNPEPIIFSGNTDCYQPIEKKLKITRQCLAVMLRFRHPVEIITKNALLLRDLDLLKELRKYNLIQVNISITTLSEEIRRLLEPRTATIKKRLKTVQVLAENDIPVNVMMAPIIPGINSHEIFNLSKKVSEMGADTINYSIVRLNGAIGDIFEDWLQKTLPDRAEKVLNQIAACHGGTLEDTRFGHRMMGEGEFARQVHQQFKIARKKYDLKSQLPALDKTHFLRLKNPQYELF